MPTKISVVASWTQTTNHEAVVEVQVPDEIAGADIATVRAHLMERSDEWFEDALLQVPEGHLKKVEHRQLLSIDEEEPLS
jgi:hypothetical protein